MPASVLALIWLFCDFFMMPRLSARDFPVRVESGSLATDKNSVEVFQFAAWGGGIGDVTNGALKKR